MVVGSNVGRHGQGGLALVEQRQHQDIIAARLAEVDKLDVAGHREDLVALPVLVQRLQVGRAVVGSVQAHQAAEGQYHALMTEAQRRARRGIVARDGAVGVLDEVAQQVGLHIVHAALRQRRLTRVDIPVGVVVAPHVVDVVGAEQVIQVHVLKLVVALHVARHLKQVKHHRARLIHVDAVLHPALVFEELLQQAFGVDPLIAVLAHGGRHRAAQLTGDAVAVVHIVHLGLAGIGLDLQPRIERGKHVHLVLHRQDAADDHRRAGNHRRTVLEHLREVLVHAAGDALMLLVADVAQLAQAVLAGLIDLAQDLQHLLTTRGEFAVTHSLLQHVQRTRVVRLVDEPAAAVAAVVADEKRFIAIGGCRDGGEAIDGIGLVIVGAQLGIGLEILAHSCREAHDTHQRQAREHEKSSHNNNVFSFFG